MSIRMHEQDEAKIREKVAAGLYRDIEEALHAAVTLLDERDHAVEWLEAEINPAQAQFDRGEGTEMTRERFMQIVERGIRDAKNGEPFSDAATS